jgi:hypothetical protein
MPTNTTTTMVMMQHDDGDSSVFATTGSVGSCNETVQTNASGSTVKTSNVGRADLEDAARERESMREELSRRKLSDRGSVVALGRVSRPLRPARSALMLSSLLDRNLQ